VVVPGHKYGDTRRPPPLHSPSQPSKAAGLSSILDRLVEGVLGRFPPERRPAVEGILRAQLRCYEATLEGNTLILRRVAPLGDLPPLTARFPDGFCTAEALAEEAERLGLRLEVVEDPKGLAKAPMARREALEALRQFVNETGILPEGEWEDQYRRVLPHGRETVEAWARRALTTLKRLYAKVGERTRHGVPMDTALAQTADPVALFRTLTDRFLRRLSPPPEAALGVPNGVGVVPLFAAPVLLHSRKRHVRVRLRRPDGTVLELERISRVGFGARAAALFDYCFSLVQTLPEEAFRPDPDPARGLRHFEVSVRHIRDLLGIRRFDWRTFRYVASVLAAQFWGWFLSPEEAMDVSTCFESVRRTRGRKAVLRIGVREHIFRQLREGGVQTRSFPAEALMALARASDPAAGLARWLAIHFHGDAYTNVPLRVKVADLYRLLVGGEGSVPASGTLRRFRSEVRRAADEVNRLGLLRLLAVYEPACVAVSVERDWFVFRRVAALADPDKGPHKSSGGGDIDASVEAWLAERTEADPGAEEETGVLYADYAEFCRSRGLRALAHQAWGRAMGRRFRRKLVRREGRVVRVWQGVRRKMGDVTERNG
jgi:hypothetical protein